MRKPDPRQRNSKCVTFFWSNKFFFSFSCSNKSENCFSRAKTERKKKRPLIRAFLVITRLSVAKGWMAVDNLNPGASPLDLKKDDSSFYERRVKYSVGKLRQDRLGEIVRERDTQRKRERERERERAKNKLTPKHTRRRLRRRSVDNRP